MDIGSLLNSFSRPSAEASRIYNLTGSSAALLLALSPMPFVAVESEEAKAQSLARDINFYRAVLGGNRVLFLPDADGPETTGLRVRVIGELGPSDSLVTSSKNLITTLPPYRDALLLKAGDALSRGSLQDFLELLGYRRVPMVVSSGEYSPRGWIIDIFPSTSEDPIRLEFFGDDIDKLRTFDIETQKSKADIAEFALLPAAESGDARRLSELAPGRKFFCLYPLQDRSEFPGDTVLLSKYSFESAESPGDEAVSAFDAGTLSLKGLGLLPEERKGIGGLTEAVGKLSEGHTVVLVASSTGQSERLRDIFRDSDIIAPVLQIPEVAAFEGRVSIVSGELSAGFFMPGLALLTEKEMFGERPSYRPIKKKKLAELLMSLDEITPGDFVVHRDHGIGRFSGVVRQRREETEIELILIEYEDGKIYIPIQNITVISKYRAEEGIIPKLDRLSGKTWLRKKERARKRVHEIAEKLVALYATRKEVKGRAFSPDSELHREFDSFFSYEETPDQLKAIGEIKRDMESGKPMERLLCGDVGYGKTEVAMRAAFKAVYDHTQVAVLVPTTILAEQHYRTFRERFSGFPVNIDFLSRFKSKGEMDETVKAVARGETDIVIGTHALLSKRIAFRRLGLLIIDEEHRFGVAQKEKVKELRKEVDVLTLTATPIPRTLHMALSGIREISVIETPPQERLAVKSVVAVFSDNLIKEAIQRELGRGGQVFFVHNRIFDIYKTAARMQELVPSARIGVAHGQMAEKELERVMHDFFGAAVDVLVSTAIVGSGLDIARANTIIIDMADRMGLADLYQLRGRVGRSSLRGYAFFLAPPEEVLTDEARKRLQAVQEMSYLGAGFRLALKDLEIRGAGEIFGPNQSGHIHEVGFDLYIEMLESAVSELKGIEVKEEPEPVLDFRISALIPEDYIEDVTLRLNFYRRIASLDSEREILEFEAELLDRFGPPPAEVINLLKIVKLKVISKAIGILKIQQAGGKITLLFSPGTKVQPSHLFELRDRRKGRIRFLPDGLELDLKDRGWEGVYDETLGILEGLFEKTAAVNA